MKGVPIKFRGRDIISNEYLYGDYVSRDEGCAIRIHHQTSLFNMHEYEIAVDSNSVAQLVGYDADGNEVYEGDAVVEVNPNPKYSLGKCGELRAVAAASLYIDWTKPMDDSDQRDYQLSVKAQIEEKIKFLKEYRLKATEAQNEYFRDLKMASHE